MWINKALFVDNVEKSVESFIKGILVVNIIVDKNNEENKRLAHKVILRKNSPIETLIDGAIF